MPSFRWSKTTGVAAFFVLLVPVAASALEPANPRSNARTKAVLSYWDSLPSKENKRVLSGQFIGHAQLKTEPVYVRDNYRKHVVELFKQTGKWVALVGIDYGVLTAKGGQVDLSETNRPLLEHWDRGGLVTVSWHARNPWTGENSRDEKVPGNFSDLFKPGTPVNKAWNSQLKEVGDALEELKQAGVTVIWRPFHEGNGRSFWWAPPRTAEQQKRLWREMFRYFTEERALDNLLWVYSVLPPKTGHMPEEFGYPGHGYVDMVGLDVYGAERDFSASYRKLQEIAPGKPLWLTEFGPHSGSKEKKTTSAKDAYDYSRLIRRIQEQYPRIVAFQAWNRSWSMVEQDNSKSLLEHPWVITLEDLEGAF